MSANANGDYDPQGLDSLIVALRAARERIEAGEPVVWAGAITRLVSAIAQREAEIFPPPLRQEVEGAVVRGVVTVLDTTLKIYFDPELAR